MLSIMDPAVARAAADGGVPKAFSDVESDSKKMIWGRGDGRIRTGYQPSLDQLNEQAAKDEEKRLERLRRKNETSITGASIRAKLNTISPASITPTNNTPTPINKQFDERSDTSSSSSSPLSAGNKLDAAAQLRAKMAAKMNKSLLSAGLSLLHSSFLPYHPLHVYSCMRFFLILQLINSCGR
jgi:hypothetical protein